MKSPEVGGWICMPCFARDVDGKQHYTQMSPARILEVTAKDVLVLNLGHTWTTYQGTDKQERKAFEQQRCGGLPNGLKFRLPIDDELQVLNPDDRGFWIWENNEQHLIGVIATATAVVVSDDEAEREKSNPNTLRWKADFEAKQAAARKSAPPAGQQEMLLI
jgi:hypothetical protein